MAEQGLDGAMTEDTSHRVGATHFDLGILTNLSQDHLNYHDTMYKYFKAKLKLFDQAN